MADKIQLKAQSLAVGRTLQMALKTAIMYSVDHPAVEKTLQDSYTSMTRSSGRRGSSPSAS